MSMSGPSQRVGVSSLVALCVGCVLGALIAAAPSHAAQTSVASTSAGNQTQKPRDVCFTQVFSRALPGKADYCLGLRDWRRGHYDSGLEFLKLAAGWGNKGAQYTLGLIYYNGHHVAAQPALGIAWLMLANQRHNDPQITRVARATSEYATAAQRQRGQQLYRQMLPTYGDKVAATRAWHRLRNWWTRHRLNAGCVRLHGAQAAAARRMGIAGTAPAAIQGLMHRPVPGLPTKGGAGAQDVRREIRRIRNYNVQAKSGVCITFNTRRHNVRTFADKYFRGFAGVVTVGPLQQGPAAPSSSSH